MSRTFRAWCDCMKMNGECADRMTLIMTRDNKCHNLCVATYTLQLLLDLNYLDTQSLYSPLKSAEAGGNTVLGNLLERLHLSCVCIISLIACTTSLSELTSWRRA